MKTVAKMIGWIMVIAGVIAAIGLVWGVMSHRLPSSFLPILLMCAPVVLVLIVGRVLIRVGGREDMVPTNVEQWTRRGPV